jgi:hypothetical protein
MDSDQLLVWLELVPPTGVPPRMGVVCRRHADAMVVPRGWTLDDRRELRPRLFRVSATDDSKARPRSPRRKREPDAASDGVQLSMAMTGGEPVPDHVDEVLDGEVTVGEIRPMGTPDADETQAMPWRFSFDERDDLQGLLKADSPLLSRAFRGQQRADNG